MKCCRVHQDGDFGELTVLFDAGDFDQVAEVMQPRRRRVVKLTAEQRAVLVERLHRARDRQKSPVQTQPTPRPCVSMALDGSQPQPAAIPRPIPVSWADSGGALGSEERRP